MATTSPPVATTQSPFNPSISHPTQIIISENLKQAALDHIAYLKEFYDHPEYLKKQSREYAVYRYETFWLPFLAETMESDVIPPLDILFVWHSHMLAPTAYASDCERLFGRILSNRVRARTPQLLQFSEQLWMKKYNRTMPYELDYSSNIQVIPPYTSKIKYALSQAVERQADFYYNVALGHYTDSEFLDEAVKRYKKFIYLKRLNPQLYVVPMYDIDIIWHTHQLFPEAYRRDMIANLQHVLHHDDTVQDRTSNSKLSTSDHETRHKWFELYGDRLPKNGCMYRGKTSKDFYQFVTDFNFLLECQRYTMYVQFLDNKSAATGVTRKDNDNRVSTIVSLHDHSVVGEPLPDQIFAQINSSEQELFARGSSGYIEAHFEADYNDLTAQLSLKIQQKAGYWPMNYFSTLEEFEIPADKLLPITQYNQPVKANNNVGGEDESGGLYFLFNKAIDQYSVLRQMVPTAKRLTIGISAMDVNTVIVRYDASQYEEATLDTNYLTQLGTSFLFNLENVKVRQALHSILPVHQDQPTLLNIRHTILNEIDIFTATFNSAIFASCHSLNWSQLPLPNQVSTNHDNSIITFEPEKEEALIIKDHSGDWGIVKFSKDLFTGSLDDNATDKNYQFSLYRFMPDGQVEEEIVYVDWEDDKWLIGSNNFGIEMNTWSISVKRIAIKNSMQYICLGAALISRFDTLFTQIFGRNDDETHLTTATNGNYNDNDLLANDIGKINLNGSTGINNTRNTLSNKTPQMAMNHV
ncbi:unnamed protein product [Adineta steineri]|uniref:Uncharacterized protein n=1 Tax=Adineta steineri TaxID=433720 RepID=A0A814D5M1_9BILA|nr:unnamed protein product [Adineta steineri]CAF3504945.1 unnamed protein product [Adineta steineri]